MTFDGSQQPVSPSDDPDTDAEFAAYLADIANLVDDPVRGEEYRAILDEDPETQRALFDLAGAMAAATATAPPLSMLVTAVAMLIVVASAGGFLVLWVLT